MPFCFEYITYLVTTWNVHLDLTLTAYRGLLVQGVIACYYIPLKCEMNNTAK